MSETPRRPPRLLTMRVRFSSGCIPIDFAALHDEDHAPHGRDVFERVAIDRDEIRLHSSFERSDLVAEPKRFSSQGLATYQRHHRILLAVLDAIDELLGVAAMGAGDSV